MCQTHSHPCMMSRNKWPADRWGLVHENRVLEHAVCIYIYVYHVLLCILHDIVWFMVQCYPLVHFSLYADEGITYHFIQCVVAFCGKGWII